VPGGVDQQGAAGKRADAQPGEVADGGVVARGDHQVGAEHRLFDGGHHGQLDAGQLELVDELRLDLLRAHGGAAQRDVADVRHLPGHHRQLWLDVLRRTEHGHRDAAGDQQLTGGDGGQRGGVRAAQALRRHHTRTRGLRVVEQYQLGAVAPRAAPGDELAGRAMAVPGAADRAADQVFRHRRDRVDDLQRAPHLV
jgi:hypothetical protein